MDIIKTAVIGTGGIANLAHLPALQNMPGVELIAACDIKEEALQTSADKYDIKHRFLDYKKLLEMDEIQAVHILTPNDCHSPIAIDCMKAGKHVLVEKPIARNVAEAQAMVDVAKTCKTKIMVAQCLRFTSESQCLKRFIEAGDLGEIYFSRVWALRRRGIPGWGVFTNKEKQGGGPLIDIGVHSIDQALFLMGHPTPVSISGCSYQKIGNVPGHVGFAGEWDDKNFTVEDFATGLVKFSNGASMVIESSFAANIDTDHAKNTFLGDKGGAELPPLKIYSEKNRTVVDITPVGLPDQNIYETECIEFYKAIREDTEVPVTVGQALNTMRIIEGIYKSSESGKEYIVS